MLTAPAFASYQFNPASFWYLYSAEGRLSAVLVEVNNTFGERRLYFSENEKTSESKISKDDLSRLYFKSNWDKDFHVSPFNSRKGSYAMRIKNPTLKKSQDSNETDILPHIDNVLTLISDKGRAKLVARLRSAAQALRPEHIHTLHWIAFIFNWGTQPLLTWPRIIFEAARLYFQRHLHVWFRPEPRLGSIARVATGNEAAIGKYFQRWLQLGVESASGSLEVLFLPGLGRNVVAEGLKYRSGDLRSKQAIESRERMLKLHVLTPSFYSRVPRYRSLLECLVGEGLSEDTKERTLHLTQRNPGEDESLVDEGDLYNLLHGDKGYIDSVNEDTLQTFVRRRYPTNQILWFDFAVFKVLAQENFFSYTSKSLQAVVDFVHSHGVGVPVLLTGTLLMSLVVFKWVTENYQRVEIETG